MVILVEVVVVIIVIAIGVILILIVGKLSDNGSSILNTCHTAPHYVKKDASVTFFF